MHLSRPLSLTLRYFDRAILAAAGAWLAVASASFAQETGAYAHSQALLADLEHLDATLGERSPPPLVTPDFLKPLRDRLDPQRVPLVEEFCAWVAHRRPGFLYGTLPPPPELTIQHAQPRLELVSVDREVIHLQWDHPAMQHVVRAGYLLERSLAGGAFQELARLGSEETEFRDRDVAARTRVAYRLVSLGRLDREDPRVDPARQLEPAEARRVSAATATIETPRRIFVIVNSVRIPEITDHDAVATAYLYVYAWDAERGAFARKGFWVEVGQPVGDGAFATGAVLTEVWIKSRPHPRLGHSTEVACARLMTPGHDPEVVSELDTPPQ